MDAVKTGAYLAMLRKTRGMTQQEAADRLGVSNKTVSKWESGGGFPDITVLPALAELYGVIADDILAGETLTERRREETAEATAAQKKRLLVRLRTRFDVCFAIALAPAAVAFFKIPYVSLASLPLSLAVVWVGYVLAAHPIRYGGVEGNVELWQNIFRKLLAAILFQWWDLVRMLCLGKQDIDWASGVIRGAYDDWKPLVFCIGLLLILGGLALGLRRVAGVEARLLPKGWRKLVPWLLWGAIFLTLWRVLDGRFNEAMAPWVERYGENVLTDPRFDTLWPKAKAQRDAEILPSMHARWAVLAAGGVSGLGLLGFQLRGLFRWTNGRKAPAEPQA